MNTNTTTKDEEDFAMNLGTDIWISDDFSGDTNILKYFNKYGYLKEDEKIEEAIDFLISNNIINLSGQII